MGQINWKSIEQTLDEQKQQKILKLKDSCTQAIYAGFLSSIKGYEFGFNEHDQANFTQQLLLIVSGVTAPISWKTKNMGVVSLTVDEFKTVIMDSKNHKMAVQAKYWELEKQVLAVTKVEDLDTIVW